MSVEVIWRDGKGSEVKSVEMARGDDGQYPQLMFVAPVLAKGITRVDAISLRNALTEWLRKHPKNARP